MNNEQFNPYALCDKTATEPGGRKIHLASKKITKIFKVLEASSDVLETNTYHLTLSYKPGDLVKKTSSLPLTPPAWRATKPSSLNFGKSRNNLTLPAQMIAHKITFLLI